MGVEDFSFNQALMAQERQGLGNSHDRDKYLSDLFRTIVKRLATDTKSVLGKHGDLHNLMAPIGIIPVVYTDIAADPRRGEVFKLATRPVDFEYDGQTY